MILTTTRYLAAGTNLDIELDDLLPTHDAYFTAYSRASLPVVAYPLTESKHVTPPSAVTRSYLIRMHARATTRPAGEPALRLGSGEHGRSRLSEKHQDGRQFPVSAWRTRGDRRPCALEPRPPLVVCTRAVWRVGRPR